MYIIYDSTKNCSTRMLFHQADVTVYYICITQFFMFCVMKVHIRYGCYIGKVHCTQQDALSVQGFVNITRYGYSIRHYVNTRCVTMSTS